MRALLKAEAAAVATADAMSASTGTTEPVATVWEYSSTALPGSWLRYPADTNHQIESSFMAGCTPFPLSPKHQICFITMVQTRTYGRAQPARCAQHFSAVAHGSHTMNLQSTRRAIL